VAGATHRTVAAPGAHGRAAGATVALLPGIVARGASGTDARFVVATAVSVSGLVGFLSQRPGQPMTANVRANAAARDAWQRRVDAVRAENGNRRASARLVVRAGPATVAERGAQ